MVLALARAGLSAAAVDPIEPQDAADDTFAVRTVSIRARRRSIGALRPAA
jgi:hypothetical protein